jgi:hypothetical protein
MVLMALTSLVRHMGAEELWQKLPSQDAAHGGFGKGEIHGDLSKPMGIQRNPH